MTRPILAGPITPDGQPISEPGERVRIEFKGKYLTELSYVVFKYYSASDSECYEVRGAIDEQTGRTVVVSYEVPPKDSWTCKEKETVTGGEVEVTVTNEEDETDGSVYP